MNKQQELARLQSLPLEEKAAEQKKTISCLIPFCIGLVGFVSGLVYWFGTDYIFSYRSVGPFWGFVLLTIMGLSIAGIVSLIYNKYWEEFNKVIKSAREDILNIIKSGQASEEDLERYKKIYIESKIGEEPLTEEEFEWHSTHFCWGCGNEQVDVPVPYVVHKERTETWTEGNYKYSKTFNHQATILLCPKCQARLTSSDKVAKKEGKAVGIIFWILIALIVITTFTIMYLSELNSRGSHSDPIGNGIMGALISFGISMSLGRIIVLPLAMLISLPFSKYNKMDTSTKWSFDEIPSVRHFLDRDLPHTK